MDAGIERILVEDSQHGDLQVWEEDHALGYDWYMRIMILSCSSKKK